MRIEQTSVIRVNPYVDVPDSNMVLLDLYRWACDAIASTVCNIVMLKPITQINVFSSPQADHLRHQTLLYMSRILTIGQTAQGLHAMGGYFHRLRTLSSSWAARSCDPAFTTQSSNSVFFEP